MEKRVATNIRLPASLHRQAKLYAARHGKSLAQVVREAVEGYVVEPRIRPEQVADDPFFRVIGIGESEGPGKPHAKDHDDELYGTQR